MVVVVVVVNCLTSSPADASFRIVHHTAPMPRLRESTALASYVVLLHFGRGRVISGWRRWGVVSGRGWRGVVSRRWQWGVISNGRWGRSRSTIPPVTSTTGCRWEWSAGHGRYFPRRGWSLHVWPVQTRSGHTVYYVCGTEHAQTVVMAIIYCCLATEWS